MWPIDRPTPNPDNARQYSEEQIQQLAKSVKTHQLNRAILADENGITLAGYGLWLALRSSGDQEVPVQVLSHLTEAQKRTFLIADNQLAANSSWDEEKLRSTVQQLEKELVDLEVPLQL